MKALLVCLAFLLLASQEFKESGSVRFEAVGNPGFLSISGEGGKLSGNLVEKSGKITGGEFSVALAPFKTGISLRDEHLRVKYLEVKKYSHAKLKLKSVTQLPDGQYFWQGDLTIKDTTKPVEGYASSFGKEIKTSFKISLDDFKSIGVPSYLGVTVAKEVEIFVDAKAN